MLGLAMDFFFKSSLSRGSVISREQIIVKEQLTLLEALLIGMDSLLSNSWLMMFLNKKFQLVMDKGTLDAIDLHPDGPIKRIMYWESMSRLVASGGLLVITSCNNTREELVQEVENFNQRVEEKACRLFYLDHIRSYPTFISGGSVGSRVATVAFLFDKRVEYMMLWVVFDL